MNNDNLPGLSPIWLMALALTLAVLLLTAIPILVSVNAINSTAWIQFAGSIIASIIAISGAGIAYFGVLERMRFDRSLDDRVQERKRLALFLKLEYALLSLKQRTFEVGTLIAIPSLPLPRGEMKHNREDVMIAAPPELEEAWEYLDLFPRRSIAEICHLRNSLRELAHLYEKGSWPILVTPDTDRGPPLRDEIDDLAFIIHTASALILEDLQPIIRSIAPETPHSERLARAYPRSEPGDSRVRIFLPKTKDFKQWRDELQKTEPEMAALAGITTEEYIAVEQAADASTVVPEHWAKIAGAFSKLGKSHPPEVVQGGIN